MLGVSLQTVLLEAVALLTGLLGQGLLSRLRPLGVRFLRRLLLEPIVGLLEEGDVIVERLHVEGAVEVEVTVVLDCIAERGAVVELRAAKP